MVTTILKEDGTLTISGVMLTSGEVSINEYTYDPDAIIRAVDKFNEGNSCALGGILNSETGGTVDLNGVTHEVERVWMDGNCMMATIKILNTPCGKIVRNTLYTENDEGGISSQFVPTPVMRGVVHCTSGDVMTVDDIELLRVDIKLEEY